MRRIGWLAAALLILGLGAAPVAHAQKRVALIIGNGAYTKVPALPNPTRDAAALEKLLLASGFDLVRRADNLKLADLRRALRDFSTEVSNADIAVVFFAGHGIEVNGTNYLIPIDAVLEHDVDVQDEALPLDRVNQALEPAKRLRLIILDACRDNPFLRSIKRTTASRSIGRGLAAVEVLASDTLIAYAAKAGYTASDGSGSNSPYTVALLNHLTTPGLDVRLALGRVRDEVLKTTSSRQEPFVYGSLGGAEIALVARRPAETIEQRVSEAAATWETLRTTDNVAALEAFATQYRHTYFHGLAKSRIEGLAAAGSESARAKVDADRLREEMLRDEAQRKQSEEARKRTEESQRIAIAMLQEEERKRAEAEATKKLGAADATRPGSAFRDCLHCPEMVVIPAGQFTMGSSDEGPQHKVTIRRPFAVGKFEVTFLEWETCVARGGCASNRSPSDGGAGRGKRPVVNVSWHDAQEFVVWLSGMTGKTYRLLTEAEWEYAARAGTAQDSGRLPRDNRYPVEVGSGQPNKFGLHDMHGNAWEWCEDNWHYGYKGAPNDGSAWRGGETDKRVVRGGTSYNTPGEISSAYRHRDRSDSRYYDIGFRVARTL